MKAYEKLGLFYLGREYDLDSHTLGDVLLYEAKDLVTHAMCVGMTGSGKTGLAIGLIEEAAIDGIPVIVVDPKGDLANLLLTFPKLDPSDFLPWIQPEEVRTQGLTPEAYAAEQAERWKKGLAEWGQDPDRIRRFKEVVDVVVYTPGGTAGLPVSILRSFDPPEGSGVDDPEFLKEHIQTTVTGLLGLLGISADPIQSREHIFLSALFDRSWKEGRGLDLEGLIAAIQSPPFSRIGVMDLESFFPSKERFSLAMRLNALLAAPGFEVWMRGNPLDIDRILYDPLGKPRIAIFSIAHLDDPERMFFVTLLLNRLLGWMRVQPGTSTLRVLFYMDEIFGYFPPVANPPSKAPLLTLLKQARAFGLGIVLSTQNPVDLDYKALANIGTWFIGRLQTDQDKRRLLDGLEGASTTLIDRAELDRLLSRLGKRIFLLHNVHENAPVVFQTRWTLSYLAGPLTRDQIKRAMAGRQGIFPPSGSDRWAHPEKGGTRPVLPPEIPAYFIPATMVGPSETLLYEPMLGGIGTVYYTDPKQGIQAEETLCFLAEFPTVGLPAWDEGMALRLTPKDLKTQPEMETAIFTSLPPGVGVKSRYLEWARSLHEWLFRRRGLTLFRSPSFGLLSRPGESERDFRIRLQLAIRERRDAQIERLKDKYAVRIGNLKEQIRRAELAVEREKAQTAQQKVQTAIALGSTVLGAFLGRKAITQSTVGRAAAAVRGVGRAIKEEGDVARAEANLTALQERLRNLEEALAAEVEALTIAFDPDQKAFETFMLRPKKTDITVSLVGVFWLPFRQDSQGGIHPAWRGGEAPPLPQNQA